MVSLLSHYDQWHKQALVYVMTVFKIRQRFMFHKPDFLWVLKVDLIWHVIHLIKSEFNEDSESEKIDTKSWPKKKLWAFFYRYLSKWPILAHFFALGAKKGSRYGVPARHHPEYQTRHIGKRESTKISPGCFFLCSIQIWHSTPWLWWVWCTWKFYVFYVFYVWSTIFINHE